MTEGTFSNNVLSLSRPVGAINIDMSSLATKAEVQAIGVTSTGNQVTVNGTSASTVNSVSGSVTDGNLKISVNGVESGDIPLPEVNIPVVPVYPINITQNAGSSLQNYTLVYKIISEDGYTPIPSGYLKYKTEIYDNSSFRKNIFYYAQEYITQDIVKNNMITQDMLNTLPNGDYALQFGTIFTRGSETYMSYSLDPEINTAFTVQNHTITSMTANLGRYAVTGGINQNVNIVGLFICMIKKV